MGGDYRREGSLTRTFAVDGKDYGLCNEGELISLLKKRGLFFDSVVAKEELAIRIITRRVSVSCEGEYGNRYLQEIHDRWQSQFKTNYQNIHYIVLTQCPAPVGTNLLQELRQNLVFCLRTHKK